MPQLKYLTTVLAVLLLAHGSLAAPPPTPAKSTRSSRSLFLIKQDGKFGYIDRAGRLAIQPRYDHAWRFAEGRALVLIESKPHFIDDDGKVLFPSPFNDNGQTFTEGYAGGYINREGYRYIDRQGAFVKGAFAAGRPFSEGFAAVGVKRIDADQQKKPQVNFGGIWYGFIDTTGTVRLAPQFLAVGAFSHGLAPVYAGGVNRECTGIDGGKWGYIDRTGRMVIAAQFDTADDFSEGLAMVGLGDSKGYIDTEGRYVIPPKPYVVAGPFKEGLAYVREDKYYYYINKQGETVLQPEFRFFAYNFSEGFVASYLIDGKKGLIDVKGRWLIEPRFDHVGSFQDGLASVEVDGKIGYVNNKGRFVWQPTK